MHKNSLSEKWRYKFDNFMARGTVSLIGGLGFLSLLIVLIAGVVLVILGIESGKDGIIEAGWQGLMRTLDSGNMADDSGWIYRLIMLFVTVGGIFIVSALIGVISSGLDVKFEELRKGRSKVIEKDHTIIYGWSSHIFSVISEISLANESRGGAAIVILGDKDKVEMEEEIREKVGSTGKTRVVCRSGSPADIANIKIVSPETSRTIIILAPEKENPDADTIKTILALTNSPVRRPEPYHIVAEIHDAKNMDVAKMVGKDEVELIEVGDLISRVIAQTCRQSGLSIVYIELLDFGGDEIYFKGEPSLTGKTYGETLFAYEDSAVMGIITKSNDVLINPPMDTHLHAGDKLIMIAEDDDTIVLSGMRDFALKEAAIQNKIMAPAAPEYTLVLGWNHKAATIITELDAYSAPDSGLTVVADYSWSAEEMERIIGQLKNIKISFASGDTTDRRILDSLKVEKYDHVILLCYSGMLEMQEADSRTLITLLHLRDIDEISGKDVSVVSEMLDLRNRALAEVTKADDFIVSDELISLIMSQVSENKYLNKVFSVLFSPEGSEIYLKPAEKYVVPGQTVNFYTVMEVAKRQNETAIGYRIKAHASDSTKAYGVVINPKKSPTFILGPEDKVIVLAES